MNCPVCDDVALSISSREGIEIDFCPQCRGVWLDRGELDKIIERAAVAVAPVTAPPRREDERDRWPERRDDRDRYERHDDDYRGKRKKKGGFLGDLFDFD